MTMMNEIKPLLDELETSLGATLEPLPPVPMLDYFTASTTVGSHTATAAVSESLKKTPKDCE
jgi:hypothetical protein